LKVLILCNDFPPLNSIGAQRPYSWFRHLREFGIEPVVVTKNWKGHSATPVDVLRNATDHRDTVTEKREYGTVIRVPLEVLPSERMLLRHGDKRRVLRKTLTFTYRAASFVHSAFDAHRGILRAADAYMAANKVDGIIASGEPFQLFRHCYLLHKKHGVPWVADYRDGWRLNYVLDHSRDPLRKLLIKWEYLFERKFLRTAACIVTIDPVLAGSLKRLHNKTVSVVYNGFDGYYTGPHDAPTAGTPLTLNHTGTLTPGQRVEFLLQAVKELLAEQRVQPEELSLRFIGLDYFPEQCRRVLSFDPSVARCIVTSPRLPRPDVLKMNAESDYLVTLTEEKHTMINAKTYDYLAVQRPVLVLHAPPANTGAGRHAAQMFCGNMNRA
jgi:glycosyltransferase involved in cell wall biosynthesis